MATRPDMLGERAHAEAAHDGGLEPLLGVEHRVQQRVVLLQQATVGNRSHQQAHK